MAFVPSGLLALLIFKSRIRALLRFMKTVYLDKKEHVRLGLTSPRMAIAGALAALVLFAPVWRETRAGRFNLEPFQRATIRASVAGEVTAVLPEEAQFVSAGSPLVCLRNLELEGRAARVASDLQLASVRATQARLPLRRLQQSRAGARGTRTAVDRVGLQLAALQPKSPISGVVVTPRSEILRALTSRLAPSWSR